MKKLTLEYIKKQFELENYQLILTRYVNTKQKNLSYVCSNGHKHKTSWNNWQSGKRCPYCARKKSRPARYKNFEEIKASFEKENYFLLSRNRSNSKSKLISICPHGHLHITRWNNWQQGKRCAICVGNKQFIIGGVKNKFQNEGYSLLTQKYSNNSQMLKYVCPKGHKHETSWSNWQSGSRCPFCAGLARLSIETIRSEFQKEGYILLSSEYRNSKQKLKYICPKGHTDFATWNNWKKGNRCPYCAQKKKKTIEEIRSVFEAENYVLLATKYVNAFQKLEYICPEGHQYWINWGRWQQGFRCAKCSWERVRDLGKQRWQDPVFQKKIYKSLNLTPNKPEKFLNNLLQQLFPNEYKYVGDFQFFLGGKNPDFMNINGRKFLIELYGDYWHKNDDPQDRIDHFKKFCFSTLVIWENELKNQDTLISKLQTFHKEAA